MKILYWLIVCFDLAVLFLFFILGLAFAPSSKTSVLEVAAFMLVVPLLFLGGSVFLFLRSSSSLGRMVAFALAASPLLIAGVSRGLAEMELRRNMDSQGKMTFFPEGPMRDMADAISRNDAGTVAKLAPRVDLNRPGFGGRTLLLSAFRQMEKTPEQSDVVRTLIQAGADPNQGADEYPLQLAIRMHCKTGTDLVTPLLDAGAKPNLPGPFGEPLFFSAVGHACSPDVLSLLLDRGADVNAPGRQGSTILFAASNTLNWKAVLLLLQRGADPNRGKSVNGLPFPNLIDSYTGRYGDRKDFMEVVAFLKKDGK
jgi:ankyrin repeat protein